jgi:hypothetical protein
MEGRIDVRRSVRIAATAAVVVTASVTATSQEPTRPLPLHVRASVQRSVTLALERLESQQCQAVYQDFEDSRGRTLDENLALKGTTAREHLKRLRWVDGARHSLCQNPGIFLAARVGQDRIFVCPRQFVAHATRYPTKTAGLILHEQLHALGLGENPPSSEAISKRVFFRCRL